MNRRLRSALPALLLLAGCARPKPDLGGLTQEFVETTLSFSPVAATAAGYHEHRGQSLDVLLDDFSAGGLERQRAFYRDVDRRLSGLTEQQLPPEEAADAAIMRAQARLAMLELDAIRNGRHNPTLYVELIGNALYTPFVVEYAAKEQRFEHIVQRLRRVPAFLEQAKTNLAEAPEIWTTVAMDENAGNIALVDKTLRDAVPVALRPAYDEAAGPALAALGGFQTFLDKDLRAKTRDWRLGPDLYARKFALILSPEQTPEQLLKDAEEQLREMRREMWRISLPLHARWYPTHRDPVDLNLIVGETLDRIAQRRAAPETYFSDARRDLAEARDYVRRKNLLPLPPRDNLQVIETPEFMRGIYAVGGFSPAPPLEPRLGAFYWLTPLAKDPRRAASTLREYNYFGLKLLTIHEAMPGHYVQSEYANNVQPAARRLLRGVFYDGPYVEGWAVYATEMMLDQGYVDHSPELRLTFLKQQLRAVSNAILDIRLHTMGMTDQEALDLITKQTFQESEEASAKLRRAKLSSCQLPTYFAGWRGWRRLREQFPQLERAEFHRRALEHGSAPLATLPALIR